MENRLKEMKKIVSLFLSLVLVLAAGSLYADQPKPTTSGAPSSPSFSIEDWKNGDNQPNEVEEPHFSEIFSKMIGLLCTTLLIFFAFVYVYKKFIQGKLYASARKNSRIEVIERYGLSSKTTVYILRIDERECSLIESPHGVAVIQNSLETSIQKE